MNKILIIATFIVLTTNKLQAQQYDTYGRTQATREWQETDRHYNSMNNNSKSTSSGNNSPVTKNDINNSLKNIELLFGLNKKSRQRTVRTAAEDAEYNKLRNEEDKRFEENRLKKLKEQQRKDAEINKEIFDNFTQPWRVAISMDYSIGVREQAFQKLRDFVEPILKKSKEWDNYSKTDVSRKAVSDGEATIRDIKKQEVFFYLQSKQYSKIGLNESTFNVDGFTQIEIAPYIGNMVYCRLLAEKNPSSLVLEKSAYTYALNPTYYLTQFAYTLFLDNQIDLAADVIQKHLTKYPLDTIFQIKYTNKLILLKLIQGKDAEALQVYNNNSSLPITDKNKLLELIAFNIFSLINQSIVIDNKSNYYAYPTSDFMDIDLLAYIMPENDYVQNFRKKLGVLSKSQRLELPINRLWENVEKKNIKYSLSIELLAFKGSSPGANSAFNLLGTPAFVPERRNYEAALNELYEFNREKHIPHLKNFEIINGYYVINEGKYKTFYKIEDLKIPVLMDGWRNCYDGKHSVIQIHLKPVKFGCFSNNKTAYQIEIEYTSKSQANKALKLYKALFEKIQKQ
jgi:hypothetical protein